MRMWIIAAILVLGNALAATPARSAPATPVFGPTIDEYADYQGQETCDPTPKPGVVGFKDLLQLTYGVHSWGISRSCETAGISEHEEGRALDYHFDYFSEAQRAEAEDLLSWLLATDQYGNTHAMARRLGMMYIIWNSHIWEAYRPFDGWQPYGGANPHTDHIHFSFSWPGALAQTSWWTGALIPAPPPAQLADFDGDGRLDVVVFGAQLTISRNVSTVGIPAREPAQRIPGDWASVADPMAADWNGDARADIIGRQGGSLKVWLGTGAFTFAEPTELGPAELGPAPAELGPAEPRPAEPRPAEPGPAEPRPVGLRPVERYLRPADFDGDGRVDLASLSADGVTLSVIRNTVNKMSIVDSKPAGLATARKLVAVDWDGDARADLLGQQTGQDGGSLMVWLARADATFADPVVIGTAQRYLDPADFDGDGKPDLAALTDDARHLVFSRNTSMAEAPSLAAGQPVIGGWAAVHQLMAADFDGDGRADVVGRHGGILQVWLSNSTPAEWAFHSSIALVTMPLSIKDD